MKFPLQLSFKKLALAPQVAVTDADGKLKLYVKQKLFKLKESVTVFADREQTQPLYHINADRVLDFSARYTFTNREGTPLGALKRQGRRSLWRARYDVLSGDVAVMTIHEESPWVKVVDGLIGDIPVVGMFSGYFLHPAYTVERPDGGTVMRLVKEPAFWESRFRIERHAELEPQEEGIAVLSLLMVTLLERERG